MSGDTDRALIEQVQATFREHTAALTVDDRPFEADVHEFAVHERHRRGGVRRTVLVTGAAAAVVAALVITTGGPGEDRSPVAGFDPGTSAPSSPAPGRSVADPATPGDPYAHPPLPPEAGVPQWLPDGYQLVDVEAWSQPKPPWGYLQLIETESRDADRATGAILLNIWKPFEPTDWPLTGEPAVPLRGGQGHRTSSPYGGDFSLRFTEGPFEVEAMVRGLSSADATAVLNQLTLRDPAAPDRGFEVRDLRYRVVVEAAPPPDGTAVAGATLTYARSGDTAAGVTVDTFDRQSASRSVFARLSARRAAGDILVAPAAGRIAEHEPTGPGVTVVFPDGGGVAISGPANLDLERIGRSVVSTSRPDVERLAVDARRRLEQLPAADSLTVDGMTVELKVVPSPFVCVTLAGARSCGAHPKNEPVTAAGPSSASETVVRVGLRLPDRWLAVVARRLPSSIVDGIIEYPTGPDHHRWTRGPVRARESSTWRYVVAEIPLDVSQVATATNDPQLGMWPIARPD